MTHKTDHRDLLNKCVELATLLGIITAQGKDATLAFTKLKAAIDKYIAATSHLPPEEKPTREHIERVLTIDAYLACLFQLGLITTEEVPDAFARLEAELLGI